MSFATRRKDKVYELASKVNNPEYGSVLEVHMQQVGSSRLLFSLSSYFHCVDSVCIVLFFATLSNV